MIGRVGGLRMLESIREGFPEEEALELGIKELGGVHQDSTSDSLLLTNHTASLIIRDCRKGILGLLGLSSMPD